jgi:poly-gamma-glutamate capsule biosynthesis protein CapA/YwtB (metallophosphatase superfamily)
VNILFAGDVYSGPRGNQAVYAAIETGRYADILSDVASLFHSADYAFVNLEAPLSSDASLKPIKKTGPNLINQSGVMGALKFLHVTGAMLANNHIADYGASGIRDTINLLEKHELAFLGAGMAEQKRKPLVLRNSSVSVALLNFAENEWIDLGSGTGANPIDFAENFKDIRAAKKEHDFVVLNVHTGCEFNPIPSPWQKKLCRFYVDAGADAVICHHTHMLSGFEFYQGKYIHYGLGNFLMNFPHWKSAALRTGAVVGLSVQGSLLAPTQYITRLTEENSVVYEQIAETEQQAGINAIIGDDETLEKTFSQYVKEASAQYQAYLEVYPQKLKRFFKKGLLPSLRTQSNTRLLLNLIRCESHREVLIKMLNNEISE